MLDALAASPLPTMPGSPVIAMVSGGSDSTALLVMAAAGRLDLLDGRGPRRVEPEELVCLHVNHSIRGAEANGDEQFVEELCANLGVRFYSARVDAPGQAAREGASSLEDVARRLRYQKAWELAGALSVQAGRDIRTSRLLVAHTADDRAETFLMRAMGGAGLTGMTGMRARRGLVLRPLLGSTRQELRDWLSERGIGWREDSTNSDDQALRSYVRHHVTPAMRLRAPSFAQVLGRSLDLMADDADLLDRLAHALLDRAARPFAPADEEYARVRQRLEGSVAGRSIAGQSTAGQKDADDKSVDDKSADEKSVDEKSAHVSPIPDPPRDVALDAAVLAGAEPALARRAILQGLHRALGEERAWEARFESAHAQRVLALAECGQGTDTLPLDTQVNCADGVLLIHPSGGVPLPRTKGQEDRAASASAVSTPVPLAVPGSVRFGFWELRADLVPVPAAADAVSFARQLAKRTAQEMPGASVASDALASGVPAMSPAVPSTSDPSVSASGAPTARQGKDFLIADADALGVQPTGELVVCGALPGMRMKPWGMGGHRKLIADLLMEASVPAALRAGWPVVCTPAAPGTSAAPEERATGFSFTESDAEESHVAPAASALPDPDNVVFLAGIRAAQGPAYGPDTRVLLRLQVTFDAEEFDAEERR